MMRADIGWFFVVSKGEVQHDVLPPERLIYCCFTFRNLHHCQGGLSPQHFITAAVLRPLPNVSLQNILVQINASNLASWYLYWPFNERFITDHFCLPESPKGVLCNAAWSCPNGGVNHASCDDRSVFSLYYMKNDFVIVNVPLPLSQICSNETGERTARTLLCNFFVLKQYDTDLTAYEYNDDEDSGIVGGRQLLTNRSPVPYSAKTCIYASHAIARKVSLILYLEIRSYSYHCSPSIAMYFYPDKISRHRS